MEEHGFEQVDSRNSVVIPLAFFDKLLKCYYGSGPRHEEKGVQAAQESPAVEVVNTESLRDLQLKTSLPEGYQPKGVALRKIETRNADRSNQVNEEQEGSGQNH